MKIKIFVCCSSFVVFLFLLFGCRTAPSTKELASVYYDLGNAYTKLGRPEDAGKAYRRAFVLQPDLVKAAYNLGRIDIETGKYKDGIALFQQLLKKDPENMIVKEALAWGYFKKGDIRAAMTWYKNILSTDPYNKNALHNICVLLISEGKYADAYPYLKQAESSGSKDFYIYEQLGIAESKLGISPGIYWFERARQEQPDDNHLLDLLASAYSRNGDYSSALRLYNTMLKKNNDPAVLFKKAFILLTAMEDYDNGIEVLKKALAAGFSDKKELKKLRDYPDLLYADRIKKVLDGKDTVSAGS